MGLDPAFGSSTFGIVISRFVDNKIEIIYADEFDRPDYNEMIQTVWQLYQRFNLDGNTDRIYVDGANPSFIRSLKLQIGERPDYDKVLDRSKSTHLFQDPERHMVVVPVDFSKDHRDMLMHCKSLLSYNVVKIHPKFEKLITALRTARDDENKLLKDEMAHDDLMDSFRLALKYYRFEQQ
jgi:hypothetical protein